MITSQLTKIINDMVQWRKWKITFPHLFLFYGVTVFSVCKVVQTKRILLKSRSVFNWDGMYANSTNVETTTTTVRLGGEKRQQPLPLPTTTQEGMKAGDVFAPGSLNLTRLETYQRCHVDPIRYRHHLSEYSGAVEMSAEHGLSYTMIPKAGSSGIRQKMRQLFNAKRTPCKNIDVSNSSSRSTAFQHITFTRDPMSRFKSAFQEAMLRWKVMNNGGPYEGRKPQKELGKFITHYQNASLRNDHNLILNALEVFVLEHYDGFQVPNDHLRLQVPVLSPSFSTSTPDCPRLDVIHDLEDVQEVFTNLAAQHNFNTTISSLKVYEKKLRLDMSKVRAETQRKICQISALDYCCLNYKLPPECKDSLSCQWKADILEDSTYQPHPSSAYNLLIEAISPYPILPL